MTNKTSNTTFGNVITGVIATLVYVGLIFLLMNFVIRRTTEINESYCNCIKNCETCGKIAK